MEKKSKKDGKQSNLIFSEFKKTIDDISSDQELMDTVLAAINKAELNDLKLLRSIASKYQNATIKEKKYIIKCIIAFITEESFLIDQRIKECECDIYGHKFGKWELYLESKTDYKNYDDCLSKDHPHRGLYHREENKTKVWKRYCKNCEECETSYEEPRIVARAKARQYKKKRIAELKEELKELENK